MNKDKMNFCENCKHYRKEAKKFETAILDCHYGFCDNPIVKTMIVFADIIHKNSGRVMFVNDLFCCNKYERK